MTRRLLVLALLASAAACAHAQGPQQQTYTLGPFDRLTVSGSARIELTQGPNDSVTIVGDEAVRSRVRLRHSNGRLDVTTDENWKFWNRDAVQLKETMHEISRVTISGASDIMASGPVKAEDLRIDISGQGEVRFGQLTAKSLRFSISGAGDGDIGGGSIDELQLNVAGKGRLAADKVKVKSASVNISGVGQADVWVTDDLRINVSGVGTVNYWGQPKLRQDISAIATVNAKGDRR